VIGVAFDEPQSICAIRALARAGAHQLLEPVSKAAFMLDHSKVPDHF
jgi:hypothetical protein